MYTECRWQYSRGFADGNLGLLAEFMYSLYLLYLWGNS